MYCYLHHNKQQTANSIIIIIIIIVPSIPINYPSITHLLPIYYPSSTHLLPIYYPSIHHHHYVFVSLQQKPPWEQVILKIIWTNCLYNRKQIHVYYNIIVRTSRHENTSCSTDPHLHRISNPTQKSKPKTSPTRHGRTNNSHGVGILIPRWHCWIPSRSKSKVLKVSQGPLGDQNPVSSGIIIVFVGFIHIQLYLSCCLIYTSYKL